MSTSTPATVNQGVAPLRSRRMWLLAYLALLPIMVQSQPLLGGKIQPADVLFLVPLVLAMGSFARGRSHSLLRCRLLWAWGLVVAVAAISLVVGPRSRGGLVELVAYGYMMLVCLVVVGTLRTWSDWLAAARTWVAVSTTVALLGLVGVALGWIGVATPLAQYYPEFFVIRQPLWILSSTFIASSTPNMACSYLMVGALLSLGLACYSGTRTRRGWYAASAAIHAVAILLTFSRAWVAAGTGLAVFLWQFRAPAARLMTGTLVVLVVSLALVTEVLSVWNVTSWSIEHTSQPQGALGDSTMQTAHLETDVPVTRIRVEASYVPFARALLRKAELAMFLERPLLGVGPGQFARELYRRQHEDGMNWWGLRVAAPWDPHSTYLGGLAELGLIGLSAILLLMTVTVQDGLRAVQMSAAIGSPYAPLAWAIAGCTVAYALWGWHDDLLTKRWVWATAGMAASAALLAVPRPRYAAMSERVAPAKRPVAVGSGAHG